MLSHLSVVGCAGPGCAAQGQLRQRSVGPGPRASPGPGSRVVPCPALPCAARVGRAEGPGREPQAPVTGGTTTRCLRVHEPVVGVLTHPACEGDLWTTGYIIEGTPRDGGAPSYPPPWTPVGPGNSPPPHQPPRSCWCSLHGCTCAGSVVTYVCSLDLQGFVPKLISDMLLIEVPLKLASLCRYMAHVTACGRLQTTITKSSALLI